MSVSTSPLPVLLGALAGTVLGFLLAKALQPKVKPTTVKHVFLGRFKDGITEEEVQSMVDGYAALPKTIKSMKAFEWGTNVSCEGLDKGFTHVFVTTFDDQEGVDSYIKHEDHIEFARELLGLVADVVVVDYIPKVLK